MIKLPGGGLLLMIRRSDADGTTGIAISK